jgi:hypothetical protein
MDEAEGIQTLSSAVILASATERINGRSLGQLRIVPSSPTGTSYGCLAEFRLNRMQLGFRWPQQRDRGPRSTATELQQARIRPV